jgi:hypothetical protein
MAENLNSKKMSSIFLLLLIVNCVFLSSCVSAQEKLAEKDKSPVPSDQKTEQKSNFQSVKSCKVLEVPQNIFDKDFNPIGGYQVFGENLGNLSDFSNFTLDRYFEDEGKDQSKLVGGVVIKIGDMTSETYQIEKLFISHQEIKFSTESLNNIKYEFSGNFLKDGNFTRFNEKDIAVLEGTIKKIDSDKTIDEQKMKFKYIVWKARFLVPNC